MKLCKDWVMFKIYQFIRFQRSLVPGFLFLWAISGNAQQYTSYFTGNPADTVTQPRGGVCLMGGGSEDEQAMKWFLERCAGGDVLVLRASGSDGYNAYLYSELGVPVNSVESIVCHNQSASDDSYILRKIRQAEGIWLAGGDQWNYVRYWRNTAVDSLINDAIVGRNIVVGGTSAGLAVMGGFYFSAKKGTVTSAEALTNPYDTLVTVDSATFIQNKYLQDVITDSHYDNRERRGRHVAFLARIRTDWAKGGKGIGCNERTAVCIDTTGLARVFGHFPDHNDRVYFIQANADIPDNQPETCLPGRPLHWYRNQSALKVYVAGGTPDGSVTFNLKNWKEGTGGHWEYWYVDAGGIQAVPVLSSEGK